MDIFEEKALKGSRRRATERVRALLDYWYREKAELRLRQRFERSMRTFEHLGCLRPRMRR